MYINQYDSQVSTRLSMEEHTMAPIARVDVVSSTALYPYDYMLYANG